MYKKIIIAAIILSATFPTAIFGQWQALFSDDFNRPDGPLLEPWTPIQELLYIQANHVIGQIDEYDLMQYLDDNSVQTAALEVNFCFQNDTDGRFQFFLLGGAVSFIAKISTDHYSLFSVFPEVEIETVNYIFSATQVYKMRLEYDAVASIIKIEIMNTSGTVLNQIEAPHGSGSFLGCAIGIENWGGMVNIDKWIDNVFLESNDESGVKSDLGALTSEFDLHPAYPNPFNPSTVLSFELRAASFVDLKVYDTAGSLVTTLVNGWREAGRHEVTFDGSDLPSGIYIYRMEAGEWEEAGKMILLK